MPNTPIHPDADPELVALGDMLKELKERHFYGQFTIHFGDGIANQTTMTETRKLPAPKQLLLQPDLQTHSDTKQLLLKPSEKPPRRRA